MDSQRDPRRAGGPTPRQPGPGESLVARDSPDDFSPGREAAPDARWQKGPREGAAGTPPPGSPRAGKPGRQSTPGG
ncbi:MAG: hypothetical protein DIU70_007890 [Bacillota bacterium]|nr:MAG: hypothetical protein DIU70_13330 [Bacillota bacterium]